jgi:hypothetical protein
MASSTERILILCKTYPSPSAKYAETSCVAGMTQDGALVRLYPVPFRLVADEQQFRKWQWIEARVERSNNDRRPESHRLFVDTIVCDPEPIKAGKEGWPHRMELLARLPLFDSFDALEAARQQSGTSLALLRPARIIRLEITPARNPDWTDEERDKLLKMQQQGGLFDDPDEARQVRVLEKVPFDFHYVYECGTGALATMHKHKIVDWEAGALFRRLRRQYGSAGWEAPFRAKYEQELPARDLLLLMGTIHRFPDQWLAVGVICPPRPQPESQGQQLLL